MDDPVEAFIERSLETEVLVYEDGEPIGFIKREER